MTRRETALLVGTSFSAAPIYFELKRRGLEVTVCGGIRDDPCHQYADKSIYIDYSDSKQLMNVVREGRYDYLVPSCNDYSYLSSSLVANELGFPGFDTLEVTRILHTKKLFRKYTHRSGLKAPKHYSAGSPEAGSPSFPCLVKPVDSFSGRGVTKVGNQRELEAAVATAKKSSRLGDYVVEQYVVGTLHSHSAFIADGKVVVDFFVDEFCTVYPYQVNCSNHPSALRDDIRDGVRNELEKLASDLQISDGLIHTQFISNAGDFWIVECMRRCPGDLYGQLIERSTGVSYTAMFVAPFLGEGYPDRSVGSAGQPYGRHTITTRASTVYFSFSHDIPASDVEIIQLKSSGEVLQPAPDDKLAILLIEFPDHNAMAEFTPHLADMVKVNTLGENNGDH